MPRSRFGCIALVALVAFGCAPDQYGPTALAPVPAVQAPSVVFATGAQARDLGPALAAKERHADRLLAVPGVEGAAVGLGGDGRPAVKLFTRTGGIGGLPASLDGIPVLTQVTGEFRAAPAATAGATSVTANTVILALPVPIGVSTGNVGQCSAGTISARVRDVGGHVYALSNNHVYALENDAPLGTRVLEPGLYDTGCTAAASNVLGTLWDFQKIAFRRMANNVIDAAIALTSTGSLGDATPTEGYGTPNHVTVAASLSQPVQKYGRTTSLTHGQVSAIGATVLIHYSSGTARFVNQIIVQSDTQFIGPGDSGSLLVTDDAGANPVGLLFAGNGTGTMAIANPIDAVLQRFGVTIDGK